MPRWGEYKEIARARGALALELYAVLSTPNDDLELMKATLPAHLDYQKEMEAKGALVLAGPLSDETGELMEGAGLIIYRAETMDEARRFADADPMHETAARSYTLRRWLINEGAASTGLTCL